MHYNVHVGHDRPEGLIRNPLTHQQTQQAEVFLSAQKSSGKGTTAKRSSGTKGSASPSPQARPMNAGRHATRPAEPRRASKGRSIRNDIVGVLLAALAVALIVVVCAPGDAVVTKGLSSFLHLLLGVGAYILPFALMVWAVTFFLEDSLEVRIGRVAGGVLLIYIAVLSIFSLSIAGAVDDPTTVFAATNLVIAGGYVGGGIAWVLLVLVGQAVGYIILIALIVCGLILVGFSISRLISRLIGLASEHGSDEEASIDDRASGPYARARVQRHRSDDEGPARSDRTTVLPEDTAGVTQVLGSKSASRTMLLDDDEEEEGEAASGRVSPLVSAREIAASVMGRKGSDLPRRSISSSKTTLLPETEALATGDDIARAAAAVQGSDAEGAVISVLPVAASAVKGRGRSAAKSASAAAVSPATAALSSDDDTPAGIALAEFFGVDPFVDFTAPDASLLKKSPAQDTSRAVQLELRNCAEHLQDTLDEFGVEGQVVGWIHGPTVTAFKIELQRGVRLNKITNLADDIALSLATSAVRIMSIPGTTLVGVEVPNQTRHNVLLGDVLAVPRNGVTEAPLTMGIGKDVEGNAISADLATMPHLLIGGTTGSGKSVAINSMIMSILMRSTPREVRMILIDPKRVELTLYNDIPHLYVPVVTDAEKAASALAWATVEMDRRLKLFEKLGVRNIKQYKRLRADRMVELGDQVRRAAAEVAAQGGDEEAVKTAVDVLIPSEDEALKELPYIVIVIDELADLMMVASKDVETSISRIAAVARAAGIHLIVATQRPSTNVITGVIKANITNRIAFSVASGTDSRVILDSVGAEDLIGHGDLLFSRPEYGKPVRIQGCYVDEKEIEKAADHLKKQGKPEYHEEIFTTRTGTSITGGGGYADSDGASDNDPLLWEAAEIVVSGGMGSTSTLQRRLSVGYARAGRIMDALENKGVVGPPNGSKPREVLVDTLELESLRAFESQVH
jgi:DNA segregation ATPase FtsK/SpoIIIE, S-DNA-T family